MTLHHLKVSGGQYPWTKRAVWNSNDFRAIILSHRIVVCISSAWLIIGLPFITDYQILKVPLNTMSLINIILILNLSKLTVYNASHKVIFFHLCLFIQSRILAIPCWKGILQFPCSVPKFPRASSWRILKVSLSTTFSIFSFFPLKSYSLHSQKWALYPTNEK